MNGTVRKLIEQQIAAIRDSVKLERMEMERHQQRVEESRARCEEMEAILADLEAEL